MTDATVNAATDNTAPPAVQIEETPANKIYAGNLPLEITKEGLETFFDSLKDRIESVEIIVGNNAKVAFAYVCFSDEAAVTEARGLDGTMLDSKKVKVQLPKSPAQKESEKIEKRVRRRSGRRGSRAVPGENSEAEAGGASADATPATDVTPKPKKKKGYFRNRGRGRRGSNAPAEGTPTEADPVSAEDIPRSRPRRGKKGKRGFPNSYGGVPVGDPTKTMVFVANIPFRYKDKQLKELFQSEEFDVRYAKISRKFDERQNRWVSNGFGFVDVGDEESQTKAIGAMSGKVVDGREITVKEYQPKSANEKVEIDETPVSADDVAVAPATDA